MELVFRVRPRAEREGEADGGQLGEKVVRTPRSSDIAPDLRLRNAFERFASS